MAYTYGALPPPQGTPVEEETKLIGPTPVAPQPKTPISELLELAVQMGIKVDFEQVSAVGMPHNQTFTINCKAGDFTGIGTGPSKKKAKQNAASATLEKIKKSLDFKDHLFNKTSKTAMASHLNSVGRLQEVTVKKGWQYPEYKDVKAKGPPHMRQFEMVVTVGTLTATGKGRSKKDAKRSAANAMLDNLMSTDLSLQPPNKKICFTSVGGYSEKPAIAFYKNGNL